MGIDGCLVGFLWVASVPTVGIGAVVVLKMIKMDGIFTSMVKTMMEDFLNIRDLLLLIAKSKLTDIPSLEPKKMKNTICQIWQWIEIAFIIMWLMKLVLMIFQRSWNRCLKKKLLTIKYFCKRNWLLWKWCSMLRYKYLSCYVLYQAIGRLLL